ncbi:MAG: hypothetical protein LBO82_02630 [Synergistaceae bacterium]|nr:hypothetical protein [Synergistaceae bacterium]
MTRNIPPEDYTVKLHGAPEGVSLGDADINPKAALSVSRIEFGYGDGGVTYRQTFDPPVTFGSIPEENHYLSRKPPEPVVVEKGGGCDAGFGAGAALAVLAACLAARKSAAKEAR